LSLKTCPRQSALLYLWSDIGHSRDGKSLILTANWTKDSLKAMPEYKYERRQSER
jgi:hypothetical protein